MFLNAILQYMGRELAMIEINDVDNGIVSFVFDKDSPVSISINNV